MFSLLHWICFLAGSSGALSTPFFIGTPRTPNDVDTLVRRQAPTVKWPYRKFQSEPSFLPPIPEVVKSGETASGYFFVAQQGAAAAQQAAMIMRDDGELVWQSDPKSPFPATNFSPQVLNGRPVLV